MQLKDGNGVFSLLYNYTAQHSTIDAIFGYSLSIAWTSKD